MNMWFNHFNNQQNNNGNYFENKQDNWWEQFQKENEINKNETRADGNKTNRWDIDKLNINWGKTSYGRKDEDFHTLANGVSYTDKNVKLKGNNYQYYDKETKTISINEKEAEIVRYIFTRYAEGAGGYTISRELRALGHKTKYGGRTWPESDV